MCVEIPHRPHQAVCYHTLRVAYWCSVLSVFTVILLLTGDICRFWILWLVIWNNWISGYTVMCLCGHLQHTKDVKMSLSAGEVTPVGIEDAAHLSKNLSSNWLSKVRSSCSKSLRRSARATKRSSSYCRPTSDTRRLHGQYLVCVILNK